MARPVNCGVGGLKPGQPKDNIFSATRHDMEEIFLCNAFYVGKEDASEVDFPIFVGGLVNVLYFDRDIEFHGGKKVFSDKLPIDARDVCATVDQGASVDNFQHVRMCDGL